LKRLPPRTADRGFPSVKSRIVEVDRVAEPYQTFPWTPSDLIRTGAPPFVANVVGSSVGGAAHWMKSVFSLMFFRVRTR
jgi:hypothetical protein